MALKAVIFDLFGTLTCNTSPENRIIKEFKLDPKIHPALQRAVCGQKFQNWGEYLDKVVEEAGIESNQRNRTIVREIIASSLERGLKGVFPEAKTVLHDLKEKGYVLGLVSDCYPNCRKILEKKRLLGFFKNSAVILSYEVGMIKWDQEIYRLCLGRLGVPAEKAVMVGDNLEGDVMMSREASGGKVQGILISDREAEGSGYKVVPGLSQVPEAVEELR